MNAAIDALTPESDDIDLKSIMRSMYVSAALDDAARRMGVSRLAHQVSTGDELDGRDMVYIKKMWADVSWLMANPKPPSLSESGRRRAIHVEPIRRHTGGGRISATSTYFNLR